MALGSRMQACGSKAIVWTYVSVGVQTVVGAGGAGGGGSGGVGRYASTPDVQFALRCSFASPLFSQQRAVPLLGPAGWYVVKVKWVQSDRAQHWAAHADADAHAVFMRSGPAALLPECSLAPLMHVALGGGAEIATTAATTSPSSIFWPLPRGVGAGLG
jgi:hypothetical protein